MGVYGWGGLGRLQGGQVGSGSRWDKYRIYDLLTTGLFHGLLLFLARDTKCRDRSSL
jgi:hypothetical protein